ncbi:MAG: glycogen debranching protein GlgX [Proteobacteria bacterium]|jgi:glycogen operon protein|nr:glycogen debranching protein GlgX [Pseudomonadota bacterium]
MRSLTVTPGAYYPLGATVTRTGVNFALFSRHATRVELELFHRPGDDRPSRTIAVENRTRFVWHCHVQGLRPGQAYGYRVDGPDRPELGHRFNRHKLLMDPYARAFSGSFYGDGRLHLGSEPVDNAAFAARSLVVDDAFDWGDDAPPAIPLPETVIYEAHVKGLTAHPSAGADKPGTYLGAIEKIPHLLRLGVNAIELLPVHEHHAEERLTALGLTNYWGYNTVGFFAPDQRYAASRKPGAAVAEFKRMVQAFHAAGIEVILDVVYNHTGEGGEGGPTLCFRGIDNAVYYHLDRDDRRRYVDFSGCGNTLNLDEPAVLKVVMDSLRYWVEAMHVDGFRFDLASALGRERGRFDHICGFFMAVHQDPVISRVKLIAEPWDIAGDSYQVGNFPLEWSEWNGRYRDCTRRFWRGDPGLVPELATRLAGSADLYSDDGRTPYSSINFVTCHDGFTLNDLVSYAHKHNEANLEENRDGNPNNDSCNWGFEGPTDDPDVLRPRGQAARNLFAALMLSHGVPMILGGDEMLRTQGGNNNAYCQDNATSWIDWTLLEKNSGFFAFCRKLMALRRSHPALRGLSFLSGADRNADGILDVQWFDERLREPSWFDRELRHLAFRLQGCERAIEAGMPAGGSCDLYVAMNASAGARAFALPKPSAGFEWYRAVDTSLGAPDDAAEPGEEIRLDRQDGYHVNAQSTVILVGR